jgi:nitric oxide dioxygenase
MHPEKFNGARTMHTFDTVEKFALLLLGAGLALIFWGFSVQPPTSFAEVLTNNYGDWTPGLVVDGLLLLVINRVLRNNERRRIMGQVASQSNEFALDAVRRCREEGWLANGAMTNRPFTRAHLSRADLSDATLRGCDFSFADLTDVDLTHADLRGASFRGANLKGADLRWADLRGASIQWADLGQADLDGALLDGIDATSACIDPHHASRPELNRAVIGGYLTLHQQELVRSSFDLLMDQGDTVITGFYERLFVAAPQLRSLFTNSIERQVRKFMQSLHLIVSSLASTEKAVPILQRLGERHTGYGVEPEHYTLVGGVLIETLDDALGERFTDEVREAWSSAFQQISSIMRSMA